ncbi:hypothetical protein KLA_15675 [Cellulophaga geojensis KL-A]|uniref:Knr4/Smi1-like domain-containing protein n=1 Tax=Cellulophaga geojensis KL-A TaxID=1328323 RepID=A0ABP3B321_9FLAO|nr:SMI1/KNR4 family protein [Cellulophaga geojensis]EWH11450.1 hypothetical protein KLA_15675 [Cellulophaga geojensis KL-A]
MNEELKNKINNFLKTPFNDGGSLKGLPATDEEIQDSEKELNYKFSKDYIEFIKEFGGAYLGVNIFAFNNHSMMPKDTVTKVTKDYRRNYEGRTTHKLLSSSLVIAIDSSGNPIVISSEGKVTIIYHDSDDTEVLANDFNEFVEKIISREISDLF